MDALPRALPWSRFAAFCEAASARGDVLCEILEECGCAEADNRHIVTLGGVRHFLLSAERHTLGAPETTLVAHYDALPGSPGANDNAAAVFLLIETARTLRRRGANNWLIIFSGAEEIPSGMGIAAQGAYQLAAALSKTALRAASFYIIDCIGRGDTLVVSRTMDMFLKTMTGGIAAERRRRLEKLRISSLAAAEKSSFDRVCLVPTPFSDDAGFFRAGLCAQTLTVLPRDEASSLISASRGTRFSPVSLVQEDALPARFNLPETWRLVNTPADTPSTLTPVCYPALLKFLCTLGGAD